MVTKYQTGCQWLLNTRQVANVTYSNLSVIVRLQLLVGWFVARPMPLLPVLFDRQVGELTRPYGRQVQLT